MVTQSILSFAQRVARGFQRGGGGNAIAVLSTKRYREGGLGSEAGVQ